MVSKRPTLTAGSAHDVDRLKAVWLNIHRQHRAASPQLGPYASDDTSWAVRRRLYEQLLERPGAVLVLAEDEDEVIGYALGYVMDVPDRAWIDDTWAVDGVIAEVESLSVLPAYGGAGLGTALMEELAQRLATFGATNLILGVLPDNASAVSLYQRLGFEPTWLYMTRFGGRAGPGPAPE